MGLGSACGCASASGWMEGPGRRISGRILPTGSCGVGFFTRGLVEVRDCQTLVVGLLTLGSGSVVGVAGRAAGGVGVAGSGSVADAVALWRLEGTEELRARLSASLASVGGVAALDAGVVLDPSAAIPALPDLFLLFFAFPALGLKMRVSSLTVVGVGGRVGEGKGDRLDADGADAFVTTASTVAGTALEAALDDVDVAGEAEMAGKMDVIDVADEADKADEAQVAAVVDEVDEMDDMDEADDEDDVDMAEDAGGADDADEADEAEEAEEADEAEEAEVSVCFDFLTFFLPLPVLLSSAGGRVGTAGAEAGAEAGADVSSLATALRSRRTPELEAEYSVWGETTVTMATNPHLRMRSASSVAAVTTHRSRKTETTPAE